MLGPQIRQLVKDPAFDRILEEENKEAWEASKGFIGNKRNENYTQLLTVLLEKYHHFGCNIFLKIPPRHFPPSCGTVSGEYWERCRQEISLMEQRFQGRWNETMFRDYYWSVCKGRDALELTEIEQKESYLMIPPYDTLHTEPPARYSLINLELWEQEHCGPYTRFMEFEKEVSSKRNCP